MPACTLALTSTISSRLRWAFTRTDTVFYVTRADNTASLQLHAALGFQEINRFASERSAAGVDVLSRITVEDSIAFTAARTTSRAINLNKASDYG